MPHQCVRFLAASESWVRRQIHHLVFLSETKGLEQAPAEPAGRAHMPDGSLPLRYLVTVCHQKASARPSIFSHRTLAGRAVTSVSPAFSWRKMSLE